MKQLTLHLQRFRLMIANFVRLARVVRELGGDVHFEWPACCSLWKDPEVQSMIRELEMLDSRCDGCSLGVVAQRSAAAGQPIRKTWRVVPTSRIMAEAINENKCPGPAIHPHHARREKSDTVKTWFYPPMFTDLTQCHGGGPA